MSFDNIVQGSSKFITCRPLRALPHTAMSGRQLRLTGAASHLSSPLMLRLTLEPTHLISVLLFAVSHIWPFLGGALPFGARKQAQDCWGKEFQGPRYPKHGLKQKLVNLSCKEPIFWANTLGFTGHSLSATLTELCIERKLSQITYEWMTGCVRQKTFIYKYRLWARGHHLLLPDVGGRRVWAEEDTSPWTCTFP